MFSQEELDVLNAALNDYIDKLKEKSKKTDITTFFIRKDIKKNYNEILADKQDVAITLLKRLHYETV